ncbi:MAG: N-6 DNA methylase [Gammaproteobacteria bacterium]
MTDAPDIVAFAAALGFKPKADGGYAKTYADNYEIVVDVAGRKIRYGDEINRGDETTSNFSQPENFVVLECVNRLLEKGYRPADLTLEKKWPLGHTKKSGKADIVVRGRDSDKTLLIIECKTWGGEYDGEIARMENSGGQLFSYLQQDKNTEYLCLYTSRPAAGGATEYRNAIIRVVDRPADEKAYEAGDESALLYANARTAPELHEVWKKTFNLYFHFNGIFEDNVNAYAPHLQPLTGRDLRPLSEATKLFNRFAEILRHNNISDNANAFNRILSLILCKIVDEEKGDDQVLEFQFKEGEDTGEKIQDRLYALYKRGMDRYLREEIVYYEDSAIDQIIEMYPKRAPLEDIQRMFREIKYYTNNEFSFKEVHNEKLFAQNARVLHEVIKMLQHFRFRYGTKQTVLGDFFELLLNHGVKQSQGQFFTPVPVVRFILRSLGADAMIRAKLDAGEEEFLPKTLDYACGAGHFLTEMMDEIRGFLGGLDETRENRKLRKRIAEYKKSADWAGEYIFGVEKDYRLARTAQIACFLHGDGEANIIFGDGLEEHPRLTADRRKFDIVIANPPYSVQAFKNYLTVGKKEYSLFNHLTESASEIETLFLERTAKALRPGGLAGVIFPVSILSNGGIYEKARKLLLQKFELLGVAELGGATFIATGTSTAVLFLRRRADDYARDRDAVAGDLFTNRKYKYPDYINERRLLDGYAGRRGFAPADYRTLVARNANAAVQKSELWRDYERAFADLPQTQKLRRQRDFCKLPAAERKAELSRRLYDFALERERERFTFYMLCMRGIGYKHDGENIYHPQIVAAADSGVGTEMQRAFLGYKFSHARGREGMKMLGGGKLDAVAGCIRNNIHGETIPEIGDDLRAHFKTVNLTDCVDFSGLETNNAINLKIAAHTEIKSRWEIAALGDLDLDIRKGDAMTKSRTTPGEIPVIAGGMEPAYYHNKANREGGVITVSGSGNAGYVVYHREPVFASDCTTIQSKNEGRVNTLFVFYVLQNRQDELYALARGAVQPHVYPRDIKKLSVPLPPIRMQEKIAAECAAVDGEVESLRREIARTHQHISRLIGGKKFVNLSALVALSAEKIEPSEFPEREFNYVGLEHMESRTGELAESARVSGGQLKSAKNIFRKGDVLYGRLRPYLNKVHIARGEGVCSTDILVLITKSPLFVKFVLLDERTQKQTADLTKGIALPRIAASDFLNIKIPAPPETPEFAAELRNADARIAELRDTIASAPARKAAVLGRWL